MKECSMCGRMLSFDEFYYRENEKRYYSTCRTCTTKMQRKSYRERLLNPEKCKQLRTQARLREATRKGKLKRGVCYFCGSTNNIDGHHENYEKPFDVIWLCRNCHAKLHRLKRRQKDEAKEKE